MGRSVGWGLGVVLVISGCAGGENADSGFVSPSGPGTPGSDATTEPAQTDTGSSTSEAQTTGSPGTAGSEGSGAPTGTSTGEVEGSSGTTPLSCGDGELDPGEACDDGNQVDDDGCLNNCSTPVCGDGVVQAGVEACDDGNLVDSDACLNQCTLATCGDAVVHIGFENCDEGAQNGTYDHCAADCSKPGPKCGDSVVDAIGGETCDDGNKADGDGCSATCQGECGNPGGGALIAENGTGMNKTYCYDAADSVDTRARKACESHFGIGACCIIPDGYAELQWGLCNAGGNAGTIHFHPDPHPGGGNCPPFYVVGDVMSKGWCGAVIGNFLD